MAPNSILLVIIIIIIIITLYDNIRYVMLCLMFNFNRTVPIHLDVQLFFQKYIITY